MTDSSDLRERAIQRVKERRGLQAHLLAYILVNAVLVGTWAMVGPAWIFWPAFPLFGWGIGLVFHAWSYFFGGRITEEQIQREMHHLGGSGGAS